MHLNLPQAIPASTIHGKNIFHENGPWGEKGWGPLL